MSLKHLAIIMDGNRRWAKLQNKSLNEAYKIGIQNLYNTVENVKNLKIRYLTVFGFSTENWNRSKNEITFLLNLFEEFLDEAIDEILKKDIKVRFIGNFSRFNLNIQKKISKLTEKSKTNNGIIVTLAVNYGGRFDIIQACEKYFQSSCPNNIDEIQFSNFLLNNELPNPDLLIRTGGQSRLSNFLLWDLAYTELLFLSEMWPDFDMKLLKNSVDEYNKRKRNFGGNEL